MILAAASAKRCDVQRNRFVTGEGSASFRESHHDQGGPMTKIARDVMTLNPACCKPETPLDQVARLARDWFTRHLTGRA